MNTAAQAVKKANKLEKQVHDLEIKVDVSNEYATIKRMQNRYKGQEFSWRRLKSTSEAMHKQTLEVADPLYGKVNAYHRDVWRAVYALPID